MPLVQVIAGADLPVFNRLTKMSGNLLAPNGRLVVAPARQIGIYDNAYVEDLVGKIYSVVVGFSEDDPVNILFLYFDNGAEHSKRMLSKFFPFVLPLAIGVPPDHSTPTVLNEIAEKVVVSCKKLRSVGSVLSGFTHIANLSPLLLPLGNFQDNAALKMTERLYERLAAANDPEIFIKDEIKRFKSISPYVKPPDSNQHCFSDGSHFFRSPGKDRHGVFRNSAAGSHPMHCLLTARSRLGGAYDHSFHFDVTPTKGKLRGSYDNCHGVAALPKTTHVNIAPNDYII